MRWVCKGGRSNKDIKRKIRNKKEKRSERRIGIKIIKKGKEDVRGGGSWVTPRRRIRRSE